ncbi:MAG: tRNA uridine-5-carboxymethylaminomethyl(34) synthesis GTPase MnmE [Oscillospiraceae bacterium]
MQQKTIAAIATPLAVGGISVIRISGEDAIAVADKVFKSASGVLLCDKKGYTASYGSVYHGDQQLDTSVAVVYRAPKSYTGEDVVEISCHGGLFITREVLRAVIDCGAANAQAGEFTKRAFLNGKLTLTQAEAVIDVINCKNAQALNAAKSQLDGALFRRIQQVKENLLKTAGHLAAWVDYPEEDIDIIDQEDMMKNLKFAEDTVIQLLNTFDTGKLIKEGIDTVIVGKPNVGKSTLMNLLAGCQKSIVTEIAGTTRDIVEETVNIGDVMLRLSDTAGIHETEDMVEKFGVALAKERLGRAALILAVFDSSTTLEDEDYKIIKKVQEKPSIAVINKTDLDAKIDLEHLEKNFQTIISISAKEDSSIQLLETAIKEQVQIYEFDMSAGMIATERQRECATNAKQYIEESIVALKDGMTLDAVTVSIEMAIDALLELTGGRITEEIVNEVFSHFCVGK